MDRWYINPQEQIIFSKFSKKSYNLSGFCSRTLLQSLFGVLPFLKVPVPVASLNAAKAKCQGTWSAIPEWCLKRATRAVERVSNNSPLMFWERISAKVFSMSSLAKCLGCRSCQLGLAMNRRRNTPPTTSSPLNSSSYGLGLFSDGVSNQQLHTSDFCYFNKTQ